MSLDSLIYPYLLWSNKVAETPLLLDSSKKKQKYNEVSMK